MTVSPPLPPARRGGFTLTELLTSLGIIALLAGLIVPAVLSARAAARTTQCRNNLKQFGLALHVFESVHGHFPAGAEPPAGGAGPHDWYAPHVRLLPHLDQGPLSRRIDLSEPSGYPIYTIGGGGDAPADAVVAAFVCPSDPAGGGNNYRVCTGSSAYFATGSGGTLSADPVETAGAFGVWFHVSQADVRDGMGQTAAACEKLKSGPGGSWQPDADAWYTSAAAGVGRPETSALLDLCSGYAGTPAGFHADAGRTWFHTGFPFTWYNHASVPNPGFPDCSVANGPGYIPAPGGVYAAASGHAGGVNLLLMDGAVRFVADGIDPTVWRALSTRAGGETVAF